MSAEVQIKITYKPLWKLLIDRGMTKTELRKKTQIAPSTFTKMPLNWTDSASFWDSSG